MRMALMFALYPTCKAIIIYASWQSQASSLLHLLLFAFGYDMTVRLISSLLHIPLPLSLHQLLSHNTLRVWFQLWSNNSEALENLLPLSLCDARDTSFGLFIHQNNLFD